MGYTHMWICVNGDKPECRKQIGRNTNRTSDLEDEWACQAHSQPVSSKNIIRLQVLLLVFTTLIPR